VSTTTITERLTAKTPEAMFLHRLEAEFHIPPRIGRQVLETACETLLGSEQVKGQQPGQVQVIVTAPGASFGPKLNESERVRITLTMDSGADDVQVKEKEGPEGLRRGRILRMTEEALEQGGVLTQEDLARLLNVDRRTIERDVCALREAKHAVHTRGMVKNVGRGQTHKVKIIELWLNREGYDKIARWVHHTPQAIKRYISTFLRMVVLHRQGKSASEIAFVTQSSQKLVKDYLELYEKAMQNPSQQEKLAEELERVSIWERAQPEKGGMRA
jgi:biotin operon repressor